LPFVPFAFHDPEQLRLLEAFANQSAAAIERAKLAADARSAWERVEAEFMQPHLHFRRWGPGSGHETHCVWVYRRSKPILAGRNIF
jgi:hypothetical protein